MDIKLKVVGTELNVRSGIIQFGTTDQAGLSVKNAPIKVTLEFKDATQAEIFKYLDEYDISINLSV